MSLDGGQKKAAKIAQQTAQQNIAFDQKIYDSNKGLVQPYIDRGDQAGSAQAALLGLGGDSTAAQNAFNTFTNSDGYQFRLNQGLNAVNASAAAKGGLLSGATLKALNDYGQNSASSEFGNYYNYLNNLSNSGLSAVGTLTDSGTNFANQVSANNDTASQAAQKAAVASATGLNSLIGTGLGLASSFASGGLIPATSTAGASFSGSAGLKSLLGAL